jgi:hypothetical protein
MRPFQIVIIILAAFFLLRVLRKYLKSKVNVYETVIGLAFWTAALILAIFPDTISSYLAELFGIKDNINAVLFVLIVVIGILQFRLFNLIRQQNHTITTLVRKIAMLEHQIENDEDSLRS